MLRPLINYFNFSWSNFLAYIIFDKTADLAKLRMWFGLISSIYKPEAY